MGTRYADQWTQSVLRGRQINGKGLNRPGAHQATLQTRAVVTVGSLQCSRGRAAYPRGAEGHPPPPPAHYGHASCTRPTTAQAVRVYAEEENKQM